MEREQLTESLQKIHHELSSLDSIDDQTADLLRTLTDDIRQLLDGESPTEDDVTPVRSSLQDLLLKFETEHPRIAQLLEEIGLGLGNLGI